MNKEQKLLNLIKIHQTAIEVIGVTLTNFEQRIKNISLFIHKFEYQRAELEAKLHKLQLGIAEKETGIKLEELN